MITTIIFDIGNVLIDFDWDGFIHRLFPGADHKFYDKLNETVWGGGRWDRLDAGDEPEQVLASLINYSPDLEKELRSIVENIGDTLKKRPSTPDWLKSLKTRGYRLLYLSNYSRYVMKKNPEVLDFLPLLDGGVFSCDVKLIKPQREIYECLAQKYGLIPSECVFIDDLARNIQAGKDFGFNVLQSVTPEQIQRDLNNLLEKERK